MLSRIRRSPFLLPSAVAFLLLSVVALLLLMPVDRAPRSGGTESDPNCILGPNLRIKVGSTVLAVPRRLAPTVFDLEGHSVGDTRTLCQRPDQPAIDAKSVTLQPGKNWVLPGVQIEIVSRLNSFAAPERAYNRALRLIERLGARLEQLPQRHGFVVFDSIEKSPRVYISLPNEVENLDSIPLVINCSPQEISSGDGRIYYGRSCRTGYHSITGSLAAVYRFYDGDYPPETWRELNSSVRALIDSFVEDDD